MKRRIAIILIPSLLFIGVLSVLILNQFSGGLPAEAQAVLNSYLAAVPGEGLKEEAQTTAVYAQASDRFTADMGRPLIHAPIEAYRTSPVLYDGDIIRPANETADFALPAQEVWCVELEQSGKAAEYYFLARYENLYGSTWVLYQSQNGREATETVGCNAL